MIPKVGGREKEHRVKSVTINGVSLYEGGIVFIIVHFILRVFWGVLLQTKERRLSTSCLRRKKRNPSSKLQYFQKKSVSISDSTPSLPIHAPRSLLLTTLLQHQDLYHPDEDVKEIQLQADGLVDWIFRY